MEKVEAWGCAERKGEVRTRVRSGGGVETIVMIVGFSLE